ncbi:hypothetical protein GCM10025767_11400 [Thalassotalea piscium]|uniref:Uncharacterized protein n=1 Tax=Thalassotalea piscium TaxID=1230533 RepID=A0A7X0NKE6_9GAMM|nr:hypothetical protein [Thalassotalea piscium]
MSFFRLYKVQIIVYLILSFICGGVISIENGLIRGVGFSVVCSFFLIFISYISYRKSISKYGKNNIKK